MVLLPLLFPPPYLHQLLPRLGREVLVNGHEVVHLLSRLREVPFQKLIEGLQVLHPRVLSRLYLAQLST